MPKILVVEDKQSIRRLIRLSLERVGHLVEEATDGAMAWDILQKRSYDLILVDIVMPVMDGFFLLEKMRSHEPTKNLPMILMGWMVPNEIGEAEFYRRWYLARQEARKVDPTYALVKPFSPPALVRLVNQIAKGLDKGTISAARFACSRIRRRGSGIQRDPGQRPRESHWRCR